MLLALRNMESKTLDLELVVSHGVDSISFNMVKIGRKSFEKFDVFCQLNTWLNQLPQHRQNNTFDIFKKIRNIFNIYDSQIELEDSLSNQLVILLESFTLDEIVKWITIGSDILISDVDFGLTYEHSNDNNNNRDQTYIRSDYVALLAISIVTRLLLPIWGEFIGVTKSKSGNQFKDYDAMKLIQNTNIFHSPAMNKLRLYIALSVGDSHNDANLITGGVSTDTFPDWMLSQLLIRRVSVGDIRGIIPRVNLVTFIHKYIMNKIPNKDYLSEHTIKNKDDRTGGGDEGDGGDKIPVLEKYNCIRSITVGEVAELEHSMKDIFHIATMLCPNINYDDLRRDIETSKKLMGHPLTTNDPQFILARWVLARVISPKGVLHFQKADIVTYLGLTQTILWTKGHKYLALLSTSHITDTIHNVVEASVDSRGKIPKDLLVDLDKYYPYNKKSNSKTAVEGGTNYVVTTINEMAATICSRSWNMTADMSLINDAFSSSQLRRIPIPSDIRSIIAKLVIEIGSRA